MHGGLVKIRIAAPAADNAANRALIEFVARRLGVSKHSVRIVSGAASRRKMLEVEGGISRDALAARLVGGA